MRKSLIESFGWTAPAAALLLGAVSPPALATPLYSAAIGGPFSLPASQQVSNSPAPVSLTGTGTNPHAFGTVELAGHAAAGPGYLSGSSIGSMTFSGSPGPGGIPGTGTGATFVLDNILLIAPVGTAPGTWVNYSFNIGLTGSIGVAKSAAGYNSSAAGASAELLFGTSSSLAGFGNFILGNIAIDTNGVLQAGGLFAGFPVGSPGAVNGASPMNTAVVGDTISVSMTLNTGIGFGFGDYVSDPGSAEAYADFADTAMFGPTVLNFFDPSTGAPVTGWSASSSDGCIVDNTYLCAPQLVAAPEPATMALLGLGLAGLGFARRRRAA